MREDAVVSRRLLNVADQWTVNLGRNHFPIWKFGWPDGQEVFVEHATGEVLQYSTRRMRMGAYFGAIPHWFYFSGLRRHASVWSMVVVVFSGLALVAALLGMAGGVWIYALCRRVPFLGMKRWHVLLGLLFGSFAITWVFSGLLSMGPFDWLRDRGGANIDVALHGGGIEVNRFAAKSPQSALEEAAREIQVKQLEFDLFDGEPVYLATESHQKSRVIPMGGTPVERLDAARVEAAIRRAAAPVRLVAARTLTKYDQYYVDRGRSLPLPVLRISLDDNIRTQIYVDLRTGRIVRRYGTRGRIERWLYHGLHSVDLPWLYSHRPLWDALVLALMLGGFALSVTFVAAGVADAEGSAPSALTLPVRSQLPFEPVAPSREHSVSQGRSRQMSARGVMRQLTCGDFRAMANSIVHSPIG